MKRPLLSLTGIVVVSITLGACASAVAQRPSQAAMSSNSGSSAPFVQSSEWANEGSRIIQGKTANAPPSAARPIDYGPWAYQTDPLNITGNGPVTLTAKVPGSLHVAAIGAGLGYVFPPDKQFQILVTRYDEIPNADGTAEIQVYAVISHFAAPYEGFRAWLY